MWKIITDNIGTVKDAFQILFFSVIAVLTLLTYRRARKTLLQPIKTEVFKEQVKEFAEVLKYFSGKGEVALREELGFKELFNANSFALLDSYAELFFDIEFDVEKRPYRNELCPVAIIHEEDLELADDYIIPEKDTNKSKPDPNTKASIWLSKKSFPLRIPRKMTESEEQIEKFIQSPLLPQKCIELIEEFHKQMHKNIMLLKDVLIECSKEMPQKYHNFEIMKKATTDWINAKYTDRFGPLEPKAKKLIDFVRKYYLTDELLN